MSDGQSTASVFILLEALNLAEVICGIAIIGFGIWWIVFSGSSRVLRGVAICFTGPLRRMVGKDVRHDVAT
jgi:hypothetical protein